MWRKMLLVLVGIVCLLMTGQVQATLINYGSYGFENITHNDTGNATIGENQLLVDILAESILANQVVFKFDNIGSEDSSITDVYFDDGTLLGTASIDNSNPGVSFSQNASPGNLPGGNDINPPFVAIAGFTADSDSPIQLMGVNPGETVSIIFDLQSGGTVQDVIDEINNDELRIGLHVQSFATGGSESFVHAHIPEPATLTMLGLGALGIFSRRRLYCLEGE